MLPPDQVTTRLVETAYLYTQARYCVVDWVQLREWHRRREQICYAGRDGSLESQTGRLIKAMYNPPEGIKISQELFHLDRLCYRCTIFRQP